MNSIEEGIEEGVNPDEMLSDEQRAVQEQKAELEESKEEKLERYDLEVIKSMQTENGAIQAGPVTKEHNAYNRIWIRDNALVALALIQAGETETAAQITQGVFEVLEQYNKKIKNVISNVPPYEVIDRETGAVKEVISTGRPYAEERDAARIHPVYEKSGKELGIEWGWHQNDGIGNLLQAAGALGIAKDHQKMTEKLVKYLETVEYWKEDSGIWEEMKQVQRNTILSCIAGLRAVSDYVDVPKKLIERGERALDELKPYSYSDKRDVDLAYLNPFMFGEIEDPHIIQIVEHELLRDHGVIRYHGDQYMSGGKGREAEWVLGLLMLGQAWLACDNKEKAAYYLKRADKLRVKGGGLPEAYVYEHGKYIPCKHTPLAWCHALALSLRRQLKKNNS